MKRYPNPPVPADLVEWLEKNFPPRCLGPSETLSDAHRYAGQVELAQRLIAFGSRKPDDELTIED